MKHLQDDREKFEVSTLRERTANKQSREKRRNKHKEKRHGKS